MSTALSETLRLLKDLPLDELRQVRDFATMRLGNDMTPNKQTNTDERYCNLILEIVCDVMNKRGLDLSKPPMLKTTVAFKSFRTKVEGNGVGSFLKQASRKSQIRMRGLTRLAIGLMVDDCLRWGEPVTSRVIMNHIHRLPAILDKSFPGYALAGLLALTVRKED